MALNWKLAAMMFTDIEGYTLMMQENEDLAINVKDRHRAVSQERHKNIQVPGFLAMELTWLRG